MTCSQYLKIYLWYILHYFSCLFNTLYLNSGTKFLSETLDLYFDFIKFTTGEVDSHLTVVSHILQEFLINYEFKLNLRTEFLSGTNHISSTQ